MIKKLVLACAIALTAPLPAQAAGVYGVPYNAYDLYPPYGVFPPFRLERNYTVCHRQLERVPTRHGWRVQRVTVCS